MSKRRVVNEAPQNSLLKAAVDATPDVRGKYCVGLKALRPGDRAKISVGNTGKIGGSIDIDTSTKNIYPDSHRWDYAIEYKEEIYFIEIHPASTAEVSTMIGKLDWLKSWLNGEIGACPPSRAAQNFGA